MKIIGGDSDLRQIKIHRLYVQHHVHLDKNHHKIIPTMYKKIPNKDNQRQSTADGTARQQPNGAPAAAHRPAQRGSAAKSGSIPMDPIRPPALHRIIIASHKASWHHQRTAAARGPATERRPVAPGETLAFFRPFVYVRWRRAMPRSSRLAALFFFFACLPAFVNKKSIAFMAFVIIAVRIR